MFDFRDEMKLDDAKLAEIIGNASTPQQLALSYCKRIDEVMSFEEFTRLALRGLPDH